MPSPHLSPRALRAAALGAVLMVLTLSGHAYGHGAMPGLNGLLVCAVLSFAIASAVSGSRLRPLPLLAVILGSQVLLHLVLQVMAHQHASPVTVQMVVGHTVAGLVAAVVFERGEQLVALWLAYVGQAIGLPALTPVPVHRAQRSRIATNLRLQPTALLTHDVVRRGPPAVRSTCF